MQLEELLEKNDGLLMRADTLNHGVSNGTFYNFVKKKQLQKIAKGVYLAPDAYPDEMYVLQTRYPRAIFSHDTALYLHDLSEREPVPLSVTVSSSYNAGSLSEGGTRVHYVKEPWYKLGMCVMDSPEGNPIRVYDRERTICDTVRKRSAMEPSAFNYAMRSYAQSRKKDLRRLGEYAEAMNIDSQVRDALEVLL